MSGHSKWATIKRKKGANDAKRAKIFTKILKEITISARGTSGDIISNPRLRLAVERAKSQNVPKENIDRAIKKGLGEADSQHYEDYIYEGYGPAGVGILIEVLTDNKNRTGGEVRGIFTKSGHSMAEAGAVSWNFERKGMITLSGVSEEQILEEAMEIGIQDIESAEDGVVLYCDLENLDSAVKALETHYVLEFELTMKPKSTIVITDPHEVRKTLELIEKLEDNDDVQKVYSNFEVPQEILESLGEI